MNKIEILDQYIENMNYIILKNDEEAAQSLIKNTYSTFISDIKDLPEGLTCYLYGVGSYLEDLKILRAKLVNYKSNLIHQKDIREYELKKMALQESIIKAENQINSKSDLKKEISITFKHTIEKLEEIEEVLSNDDKEKLENMLSSIEITRNSNNKVKLLLKIHNVIKFICEKDKQVIIIVLPYLGDVTKSLSN
ncbi:hypothetical protein [Terrisporobacter sp.]|uniref:hypothetical protein n=1 Tax=Terrisporobacter sp. TaxID=1965305 RepID=UPI00262D4ECE|nr:hypothetical protein [Terrisporobacter sp.]